MRVFAIQNKDGDFIKTSRKLTNWYYTSLGEAKTAAKHYIKYQNKRLSKDIRLHFEDFSIREFQLVDSGIHKV